MTSFATPADMIARYDVRTLGDLCSDSGERISEAGLAANTKLLTCLSSASGRVIASTLRAKKYTVDDLNALTGESLAYLVDITCRVAFWLLWQRKPYVDTQQRMEAKKEYDETLEMLNKGDQIFDVESVKDAGIPQVETITRVEIESDWSLFVDQGRGHFYPRRRTYKNR